MWSLWIGGEDDVWMSGDGGNVLRFDGTDRLREAEGIGAMAGQAGFRVIGAATTRSRGVRYGEVQTMAETERAIRTALQAAQKMANIRVDHVIACFSGAAPRSASSRRRSASSKRRRR